MADFRGSNLGTQYPLGTTLAWTKFGTVTFRDFSTAALTNTLNLFLLPAGNIIHMVRIKHGESFTGGSIATYTLAVGISGTAGKYASAFNVFQSVSDTHYQDSCPQAGLNCAAAVSGSENFGSAVQIIATAVSTVANLSAATAGWADIWGLLSAPI
jgi:hypothetical protein